MAKADEDIEFPDLLQRVNEIDGIERVRFVTSHPRDLSDKVSSQHFEIFLRSAKHYTYLSRAAQIAFIFSSMNRKYSRDEYLDRIRKLRMLVPDIALTTDVIVGFPGERDEDFEMTMQLLRMFATTAYLHLNIQRGREPSR